MVAPEFCSVAFNNLPLRIKQKIVEPMLALVYAPREVILISVLAEINDFFAYGQCNVCDWMLN